MSRLWRRTRIDRAGWETPPVPPYEAVATISPIPLLVVHGDADPFFPVDHAEALDAAAREPKTLWIRPGLGHAEGSVDAALLAEIATWVREAVRPVTAEPDAGEVVGVDGAAPEGVV
jgi:fermentation-respiration switch protein FrsA (DUF1100 family)